MPSAFDHIAADYDQTFTHTEIGKLQRGIVMDYLMKSLDPGSDENVLELGCGTGEDAIWMAKRGHRVFATDISSGMISKAEMKAEKENLQDKITFRLLDARDLGTLGFRQRFNLVFANFGVLNCLSTDELKQLFEDCKMVLKEKGRVIAIIMPEASLIESLYFGLKFKFGESLRRRKQGPVMAQLGDQMVKTWYYAPKQVLRLVSGTFDKRGIVPVGTFIPPSYLEGYFNRNRRQLKLLKRLDKLTNRASRWASYSDHYLIDLQLK